MVFYLQPTHTLSHTLQIFSSSAWIHIVIVCRTGEIHIHGEEAAML